MATRIDPILEPFIKKGVIGLNPNTEQQKVLCPQCSVKRKKKDEPCLSVNLTTGLYMCFNCGFSGGVKTQVNKIKEVYTPKSYSKPNYSFDDWTLTKEAIEYFKTRGISKQTLEINKIGSSVTKFARTDEEDTLLLTFPFIKHGNVVNVKYRTTDDKRMRSVKGAEVCFYGMQNLYDDGYLGTNKILITEGEIDSLSLYEAGFKYSISVPNGAGVEEEGRERITPKLEYLDDNDISVILESVAEVILVTDNDYKGKRLRDELAQRIGIDKCSYVEYPSNCKDINDVLVNHGIDTVADVIMSAKPMLKGLVEVNDLEDRLLNFYSNGLQRGLESGIEAFDELYSLESGLITLVTGVPESYKSVFLDNATYGYANTNDLHVAMFSPETKPTELHIARLASIHTGLSLDRDSDDYMSYEEFVEATAWVNKHYSFIQPKTNTLAEILALAKISILKHGTKILVIDPYSRIRVDSDIEHTYIKSMLNDLAEFAVKFGVHIFIVAHPIKMIPTGGNNTNRGTAQNTGLVTPYHIAGSSHWFNSADFILSLWKDRTNVNAPIEVHCLKSKYFHIAQSGKHCDLFYDFSNWTFSS